jgi:hypothetical protein
MQESSRQRNVIKTDVGNNASNSDGVIDVCLT